MHHDCQPPRRIQRLPLAFLLPKLLSSLLLPHGLALTLLLLALLTGSPIPLLAALVLLITFSLPLLADGLWTSLETGQQRLSPQQVPSAVAIVLLGGEPLHPPPIQKRAARAASASAWPWPCCRPAVHPSCCSPAATHPLDPICPWKGSATGGRGSHHGRALHNRAGGQLHNGCSN